jgi:methionine synthase II (cobalamin-independent)
LKKNNITRDEYDAVIDKQIAFAIDIQESLGLDIFVHGEAKETDMVEFFAQNMGMVFFSPPTVGSKVLDHDVSVLQSFGMICNVSRL